MGKKETQKRDWKVLAAVLVMLVSAYVAYQTFLAKPPAAQAIERKIEIFSDAKTPLLEGAATTAKAYSSCGSFAIYLDGKKIADGGARAEATVRAPVGKHIIEAKNPECESRLEFVVEKKECEGNETLSCWIGNCSGTQICAGGVFAGCVPQRKVCVPGENIGCTLNACKFGYATCNACGTAFGPCLPSSGNPNASCNANCT